MPRGNSAQRNLFINQQFRANFMNSALKGPQKNALNILVSYQQNGGKVHHPDLGDLLKIAKEIDSNWDYTKYGANLVSSFIHAKYDPPISDAKNNLSI